MSPYKGLAIVLMSIQSYLIFIIKKSLTNEHSHKITLFSIYEHASNRP